MKTKSLTLGLIALFVGLGALPAAAQFRGDRRSGRRDGPREFTPEQREEMYDRIIEYRLERYTSDYELTDQQKELVRARLEELKEKQKEYIKPLRKEFDELRRNMRDYYRGPRNRRERDNDRMDRARERMREIWEGSPLMNRERAAQSIESLLPENQVKKGQQRQAQRRAEWESRRQSWRERGEDMRRRGERAGRERESRFRDGGDQWDCYVWYFSRRYQLDTTQQATAQSILRELKQQRDLYRESHREDYDKLRGIEDRQARREAYEKYNEPMAKLYEQLKNRLKKIPTSSQLKAVEKSSPTSRPASPTTQPSGT